MSVRNLAIIVVVVWLSASAQISLAHRLAIFGAKPDFLILALAAISPYADRLQGAWIGFFCGWLHGAAVGANLTQYIATRTLVGFGVAWFNDPRVQPNLLTMGLTAAVSTVVARVAMLFLAAPPGIAAYVADTILSAVYNGVLVWPLYALLKRILDPVYR